MRPRWGRAGLTVGPAPLPLPRAARARNPCAHGLCTPLSDPSELQKAAFP